MILNETGVEDVTKLTFNKSFIKERGLKTVETFSQTKKELQPIQNVPFFKNYYGFNIEGDLYYYYKIYRISDSLLDTIVEYYTYDNYQLITLVKTEYGRFGMYQYSYNKNRVIKEVHSEVYNKTPYKLSFYPIREKELSVQNFEYEEIDEMSYLKCTHSSDDVCYKEKEVSYKEDKISKEKTRYFFDDTKQSQINYLYKNGNLFSKTYVNNYTKATQKRYVYRYYSNNTLSSIQVFNGDNKEIQKIEFLYKNGLLDATLSKNEQLGLIDITKYRYTYFNK